LVYQSEILQEIGRQIVVKKLKKINKKNSKEIDP
jgi:hypothetical protein